MNSTEILQLFYSNFPELVEDMKNADHNYNNDNLNGYHAEGDVWAHTMMVYSEAIKRSASTVVLFAALLHDIGKPDARQVVHESKRVRFFGHEGFSFFKAVGVLNHECFSVLSKADKGIILKLIALHSELFDWKHSDGSSNLRFKDDQGFLNELAVLVECDYRGRISTDPLHPNESWKCIINDYSLDSHKELVPFQSELTILIGPPASGKSTYVKELGAGFVVISRDSLVLEYGNRDNKRTYTESWKHVDQKAIDEELMKRYRTALKSGEDIVVDMTNMSKKSRKKFLKDANVEKQGYFKRAVVFAVGYSELYYRNADRVLEGLEGKNVPEYVIKSMCQRFGFPMYDEFDEIRMKF